MVLGKTDKLSQKLEDYPSNITKIEPLTKIMGEKYGFKEITDTSLFDLLCYWYDVQLKKDDRRQKPETPEIKVQPIDEKLVMKFYEKQLKRERVCR